MKIGFEFGVPCNILKIWAHWYLAQANLLNFLMYMRMGVEQGRVL